MQMSEDIRALICETQGSIYRLVAKQGYNVELFSDAYMQSDFCRRAMDTIYSRFQLADAEECLDFICEEIQENFVRYNDDSIFDPNAAEWIGYTYRDLYFETNIASAEIMKKISFHSMCEYYPGMHTIDEISAREIILQQL